MRKQNFFGLLGLLALAASTALADDFGAYFDEVSHDRDATFADVLGMQEIHYRVPS